MSVEVNDRTKAQRLHQEVKQWQSELNSHVIDLMFFQRMLDIYALKDVGTMSESADIGHLKQTLSSFLQFRVERQKQQLKEHEEYLLKIAEDRVLLKDREFPFKHQDVEKEMRDFRTGFQALQASLYEKIEQLKNY